MNKKLLVTVLVVVLAILGIWYFVKSPSEVKQVPETVVTKPTTNTNFQASSISSAYIYGPEKNKVKVFLYASDEKTTSITDDYCGGTKGSEVRTGDYKLIVDSSTATSDNPGGNSDITWKDSTLDIGPITFVKGKAWDGQITVDQFDPTGYKNFIVIQQYADCNGTLMQVYGYDLSQGKLVRYKFSQGNAHNDIIYNLFVTSYKRLANGNLMTSEYDQTKGTVYTEWTLSQSQENTFDPGPISFTDLSK